MVNHLIAISIMFNACSILYAGSFEKYRLKVGESIEVTINDSQNLNISRRGHLDFFFLGDKKWRVTALRSGAVMVSPAESSGEDFRVFFEILPAKSLKKPAPLTPSQPLLAQGFRLFLDVELVSKKDSQSFGIPPRLRWPAQVESQQHHQTQQVIAQPQADIFLQQALHLESGGEFKTQYQTGDRRESLEGWKSYGLKLVAHLIKTSDQKLTLDYDFKMSATASHQSLLIRHHLKSRSQVQLAKKQLIGILDTNTHETGFKTFAFIEGIPIIGPLLRLTHHESSTDQIFIWFKILKKTDAP